MADPLQVKLASLADPQLRFDRFCNWLQQTSLQEAAISLEQLLAAAEGMLSEARPALFPLVAWLSGGVDGPRASSLKEEAEKLGHFRLQRLTQFAPAAAPLCFDDAPKSARLPSYGERPLTLGERKSLARLPSRKRFELLLRDPHPAVIEQLLKNPKLTEAEVLRLVTQRPARVEVAALVLRNPHWFSCLTLRLGVALNPHTPLWQSVPLLSTFRRQELIRVGSSAHAPAALRIAAMERRNRVPPVPQRLRSDTVH